MNVDKRYIDLLDDLVQPKGYHHGGDKVIYYLTFGVDQIQYVKERLNTGWIDQAKYKGIQPVLLSLHKVLKDFFSQDDYRIKAGEDGAKDEEEMKRVYASLGENMKNGKILQQAILNKQEEVKNTKDGVLMITDLEAIHPFTRFGPIEHDIYNDIEVPIIVLYPGEMSGSALSFLEFYPEDGNYRSEHF